MEKDKLVEIFEAISAYCLENKVVSEGELLMKIRACVQSLSEREREELERRLKGDVEAVLFKSITSEEKISVFSPDMRTRINYQGELFYCLPTHRYMSAELEETFLRWAKLRSPLGALKDVVREFMERCQYQVRDEGGDSDSAYLELSALKKGTENQRRIHLFIFPTIKFVSRFREENDAVFEPSEAGEETVIVVPTEKTPAPFISCLRDQEIEGALIWVADLEKRTISPFIGMPQDTELERNFENPEEARRAVSVWMRKMHLIAF
ncbi:MAG: hypothetical protein EFT35_07655 [Methanophagales archaeon ANME-1-THS]|nr:MAG: hypothetical protein EFT35_07655 [Methanophagales archaeon ANME-1-THS]